jgi:hypothetical protein
MKYGPNDSKTVIWSRWSLELGYEVVAATLFVGCTPVSCWMWVVVDYREWGLLVTTRLMMWRWMWVLVI